MISFIREWLWRRHRAIFRYRDGSKIRSIDPIAVALALHAHPKFLPSHLHEAASGDPSAMAIVSHAACDVFGVRPFDGKSGLTVAELIELMLAFDVYCLALKKNTGLSPTRPNFTGSTPPTSNAETTSDFSVSGSIGTDQESADPQ